MWLFIHILLNIIRLPELVLPGQCSKFREMTQHTHTHTHTHTQHTLFWSVPAASHVLGSRPHEQTKCCRNKFPLAYSCVFVFVFVCVRSVERREGRECRS